MRYGRWAALPIGSPKVAGGDGDATITFRNIHEWDICAGVLMIEEAGGKVVDGAGRPMQFNRELPSIAASWRPTVF